MTYQQYKNGVVLEDNDPYCAKELEKFLFQCMQQEKESQRPKKNSLLKKEGTQENTKSGDKHVRFLEEELERHKEENVKFRPLYLIEKLDKFF